MRDTRFLWRSGSIIWNRSRGFWSPTLTAKNPEIPYLPLESAVGDLLIYMSECE